MVSQLVKYWEIVVVRLDIMFLVLRVAKNRAIMQTIAMDLKIAITILNHLYPMNAIVMYHLLPRLAAERVIQVPQVLRGVERETREPQVLRGVERETREQQVLQVQ